ncbi:hypothetical protein MHY01S_14080 [Meiothermus hypogaeus NBRC 106114]|uniref:Uncharacterized protein n=2 Tax=Meiothermus hypogaeus TaxID=884155 RepID=A0A511R2Z6_9DEIN|nr:hypothetical protein Mhypo_01422 [Meiothermus hypogaeus]GEM83242.1 hypothetical protein MHY01S_14080 [Meiothermus hypogaeus NBRC 106114]
MCGVLDQIERKVGSGSFSPLTSIPHEMRGPPGQSHTDSDLAPSTSVIFDIVPVGSTRAGLK